MYGAVTIKGYDDEDIDIRRRKIRKFSDIFSHVYLNYKAEMKVEKYAYKCCSLYIYGKNEVNDDVPNLQMVTLIFIQIRSKFLSSKKII